MVQKNEHHAHSSIDADDENIKPVLRSEVPLDCEQVFIVQARQNLERVQVMHLNPVTTFCGKWPKISKLPNQPNYSNCFSY